MSARKRKYARYVVSISVQPWNQKTHWVTDSDRNNMRVTVIAKRFKTAKDWCDMLNAGKRLHQRYYAKDYWDRFMVDPIEVTISVSGVNTAERKVALDRAIKHIKAGEVSGQECTGTRWFIFNVTKGQL